jgi:hypothetical protein
MGEKPLQAASNYPISILSVQLVAELRSAGFRVPPLAPKTGDTPKGYPLFLMMMEGEETTSSCRQLSALYFVGAA